MEKPKYVLNEQEECSSKYEKDNIIQSFIKPLDIIDIILILFFVVFLFFFVFIII